MRIAIAAVGRLKDGPERALVERYVERARALGRGQGFSGFDVAECPESRAARPGDRKAEEAACLLARLEPGRGEPGKGEAKKGEARKSEARMGEGPRAEGLALVALDERGDMLDSAGFAALLAARRDAGQRGLAFLVGGADGLDPALAARAAARIAFGRMTLPHQIVRALLAEQLYRAMTMLAGHPYHRA